MNDITKMVQRQAQEALEAEAKRRGVPVGFLVMEQKQQSQHYEAQWEEINKDLQVKKKAREAQEELNRKILGEKLGLGIACQPVYIVRMRTVSENASSRGFGSGQGNRTVVHIQVQENFKTRTGHSERFKGDLLCGRKYSFGIEPMKLETLASCPECCEIIRRHKG